jgi:hypothetical protein
MKFWTKCELKIKEPIGVIEFNKENINLYAFVCPLGINHVVKYLKCHLLFIQGCSPRLWLNL